MTNPWDITFSSESKACAALASMICAHHVDPDVKHFTTVAELCEHADIEYDDDDVTVGWSSIQPDTPVLPMIDADGTTRWVILLPSPEEVNVDEDR